MDKKRARENFYKTMELVDACFELKQAKLIRDNPELDKEEIEEMLYQGILMRKERAWEYQIRLFEGSQQ